MTFSVIMAAWNAGAYVGEALQSVLAQDHPLREVIVIDDGSTDDTLARVREVAAGDARVRVMHREDGGFATAANLALREVRGDWVVVADADDVQLPDRVSRLAATVHRHPDVTVCGGAVETFTDAARPGVTSTMPMEHDQIRAGLLFESTIFHPTVMYRTDLMPSDRAVYDTGFRMAMDYDLWTRWAGHVRFRNVPEVVTRYRWHDAQLTQSSLRSGRSDEERRRIWRRILKEALGIEATDGELELHQAGAMWRAVWRPEALTRLDGWLHRIWQANRERRVWDGEALGLDLGRRWFWAFRHAQRLGMGELMRFWRSPLAWNRAVSLRSKLGLMGRIGRG